MSTPITTMEARRFAEASFSLSENGRRVITDLADQLDEMTRKNAQSERVDHDPPGWAERHHAVSIDALRGKATALGKALSATAVRCETLERELANAQAELGTSEDHWREAAMRDKRHADSLRERLAASEGALATLTQAALAVSRYAGTTAGGTGAAHLAYFRLQALLEKPAPAPIEPGAMPLQCDGGVA